MSDHDPSGGAESPAVAKNHTVDAIVAGVLLIIGIVLMVEARRLGAGWTSDGPGAGYFPFYIGLIMSLACLGIGFQAIFSKKRDTDTFVDREQLGRVASVFIPALVYVAGIVVLGLYVASAIYIALFMIILGKYSPLKSVIVGLGVNAFFFGMFEVWFKVPLYKGLLQPLSFLGY